MDGEPFLDDGRDDGLGEELGVFFLDKGFDVGAIDLLGGGVVLFVFVEDYCI